jgi:hypothetical protein
MHTLLQLLWKSSPALHLLLLLVDCIMGECLDALQQCSLINLDESPQLLRQSLLQRGVSHTMLLWDSTEVSESEPQHSCVHAALDG